MPKDRSVYKDLINRIENCYPVNEWMHNGYHIWPILRIRLFMFLVKKNEGSRGSTNQSKTKSGRIVQTMQSIPEAVISFLSLKNDIKTIYCGAPSHRVNYLGKRYNRYFDKRMDEQSKRNLMIEYSANSKENYYKPERVQLVSNLIKWFNLSSKMNDYRGRENQYAQKINSVLHDSGFDLEYFVTYATRNITNVDRAIVFFSKLLNKVSPQKIYELCYYSTDMLGLNIVADRMEIPTIDVQHGPQGDNHLAYGSWEDMPEMGYEALPNEFHTWDTSSAQSIQSWAKNTNKHSAIIKGNPWVEGWKRKEYKETDFEWPDKLILYTLQPTGDPLEPYLLETIKKTSNKWNWWLRLHPGQMAEIDQIKKKLSDYGLLDDVNIDDATSLLLPEILINSNVHLTKFSGCAIEAFNFKTPTLIIDHRGEDTFKDYFEYDIMSSYTGKIAEELIGKINSYLGSCL